MRCLHGGILQYDFVHPKCVQALVHVRDGILRVVGGRPSGIEYAREPRRMNCAGKWPRYKRKRSVKERGEYTSECVPQDCHT